jgi:ribosomal protein S18 acetylase RimI-like enzyme
MIDCIIGGRKDELISTRRIQVAEWELYKRIRLAALLDAPYAFSSTYEDACQRSDERWMEQTESTASGADQATFIAFSGDEPIGMAALYRLEHQADAGELLQVWVAPALRGTRAARNLLDTLLAWAAENEFKNILATVSNENTRAVQFYLHYGFAIRSAEDEAADVTLVKEINTGMLP